MRSRPLRPRAFLLENVAGLAYKVHREALDLILGKRESARLPLRWTGPQRGRLRRPADPRALLPRRRARRRVRASPANPREEPAERRSSRRRPRAVATAGEAIGDLDTEENADDDGPLRWRPVPRPARADSAGRQLPLLHREAGPSRAGVRVAVAVLVVPAQAQPRPPLVDDPGATLEQHGAVSLAKPHPPDRGGQAAPDVPRRLGPQRNGRGAVAAGRKRRAAAARAVLGRRSRSSDLAHP